MKEITIYFEDLKHYKQLEIIAACGNNMDYDTHPIATINAPAGPNDFSEC